MSDKDNIIVCDEHMVFLLGKAISAVYAVDDKVKARWAAQ
jgi:hypothetical protein